VIGASARAGRQGKGSPSLAQCEGGSGRAEPGVPTALKCPRKSRGALQAACPLSRISTCSRRLGPAQARKRKVEGRSAPSPATRVRSQAGLAADQGVRAGAAGGAARPGGGPVRHKRLAAVPLGSAPLLLPQWGRGQHPRVVSDKQTRPAPGQGACTLHLHAQPSQAAPGWAPLCPAIGGGHIRGRQGDPAAAQKGRRPPHGLPGFPRRARAPPFPSLLSQPAPIVLCSAWGGGARVQQQDRRRVLNGGEVAGEREGWRAGERRRVGRP